MCNITCHFNSLELIENYDKSAQYSEDITNYKNGYEYLQIRMEQRVLEDEI